MTSESPLFSTSLVELADRSQVLIDYRRALAVLNIARLTSGQVASISIFFCESPSDQSSFNYTVSMHLIIEFKFTDCRCIQAIYRLPGDVSSFALFFHSTTWCLCPPSPASRPSAVISVHILRPDTLSPYFASFTHSPCDSFPCVCHLCYFVPAIRTSSHQPPMVG